MDDSQNGQHLPRESVWILFNVYAKVISMDDLQQMPVSSQYG